MLPKSTMETLARKKDCKKNKNKEEEEEGDRPIYESAIAGQSAYIHKVYNLDHFY